MGVPIFLSRERVSRKNTVNWSSWEFQFPLSGARLPNKCSQLELMGVLVFPSRGCVPTSLYPKASNLTPPPPYTPTPVF